MPDPESFEVIGRLTYDPRTDELSKAKVTFVAVRHFEDSLIVRLQSWSDISDGAVIATCDDPFRARRIAFLLNEHGENEDE